MKLKTDVLVKYMNIRKLNGLKTSALSGISDITLSRVKNGASCSIDTAIKISKALDIPLLELIDSDSKE